MARFTNTGSTGPLALTQAMAPKSGCPAPPARCPLALRESRLPGIPMQKVWKESASRAFPPRSMTKCFNNPPNPPCLGLAGEGVLTLNRVLWKIEKQQCTLDPGYIHIQTNVCFDIHAHAHMCVDAYVVCLFCSGLPSPRFHALTQTIIHPSCHWFVHVCVHSFIHNISAQPLVNLLLKLNRFLSS